MSPAVYRALACVGAWGQLAHVVTLGAVVRSFSRALEHAEKAVHGDIALVTRELASVGPIVRVTSPIALVAFILLLVAVMHGQQRARWLFSVGLLASLFYLLAPVFVIVVLGVPALPLGLIPGLIGTVHFIARRREYSRPKAEVTVSTIA